MAVVPPCGAASCTLMDLQWNSEHRGCEWMGKKGNKEEINEKFWLVWLGVLIAFFFHFCYRMYGIASKFWISQRAWVSG